MAAPALSPDAARVERVAVAAALAAGIVYRLLFGWHSPLWLDETYTAVIATQTGPAELLHWCRNELSGPLFYVWTWLWEKLAGPSNFALRLPSLVWSLAALAAMAFLPALPRRERWIWAGLTAVWLPGAGFASQARPQALLILVITLQTIAFYHCLGGLTRKRVLAWSALGGAALLLHLHSGLLIALEGLSLLWIWRAAVVRHGAALLPLAAAAAWLPLQLPFVQRLAAPGVAWYALIPPKFVLLVPVALFGPTPLAYVLVALVCVAGVELWRRRQESPPPVVRREVLVALCGVLGVVIVVGVGMIRPSFTQRYLVPFLPAVLWGAAFALARARMLGGLLPTLMLFSWAGTALVDAYTWSRPAKAVEIYPLEFERGAQWLMQQGARRVLFVWRNTSALGNTAEQQTEVGGFFFRRAGYAADVRGLIIPPLQQTPATLSALAAPRGEAILWTGTIGTPRFPGYRCAWFDTKLIRTVACVPSGAAPAGTAQAARAQP